MRFTLRVVDNQNYLPFSRLEDFNGFFFPSGQEECTTHYNNTEAAAEKMSYFYNLYKEGKHLLPQDTQNALQGKIDVNVGERESRTVSSLLYTGGGKSWNSVLCLR
jgi:hypothetical protein